MAKNYYDILNVNNNFTEDELKKAYKKACLKYHPDRLAGKSDEEKKQAEEKFKDIQEAYECLSDPQKRAHYDRFGSMDGFGQGWSGGADFGNFNTFFDNFDFGGFADIFGGGNRKQRQTNKPGQSIKININVDIKDILTGSTKKYKYNRNVRCTSCGGTGGTGVDTCSYCNGTGMITTVQQSGFGIIQNSRPCTHCNGTGKVIKNKCSHCSGNGFVQQSEEIQINIPKFVPNMYTMKIQGKGCEAKSKSMPNGDLIVTFLYNYDSTRYAIDGSTGAVYERIAVSYYDCLLGATLKRTLPNGEVVTVTIPEGSDDSTQVKIKNHGLRNGDYIFIISPFMPKTISKEEKKLLEKIRKLHK